MAFGLNSAGGFVSLLNDPSPQPVATDSSFAPLSSPRPTSFCREAMSSVSTDFNSSSTESLSRSGDRSTASTSPPTSVDHSYDTRNHQKRDSIRLPRIHVPGESESARHGLQGYKFFRGDHISASPKPMNAHQRDSLPPSTTGIFPPGQWDRAGAYLQSTDYSRRSSSSSADSMHPFDRPAPYADMPSEHNGLAKPKDSSSSAITVGGKKRYRCQHPGCDKTFSTSGHAARHNRIHTGQKPYRCTFPGCKARFSRQDNSLQHYRTHILHPKGRASQSVLARDAAAQLELDHNDLDAVDAEAEAKAELGRRALEDGTAIAVVHDVKDQHGRKKGETIERMVGMPRTRADSLRSGILEDERSPSPSSADDGRIDRQNSLPGAPLEGAQFEPTSDYWSSQVMRQGRLSLPHPQAVYDPRFQNPAPPAPYGRDAMYPASTAAPGWTQAQAGFIDPRFSSAHSRPATASPSRRDLPDAMGRPSLAILDPDLSMEGPKPPRSDDRSFVPRYDGEPIDEHRRSASTSSSHRDGARAMAAPPSALSMPSPSINRPSSTHVPSAPGSVVASARSSQSPKSSPTSSVYSVPEGIAASALDKLSATAGASPASSSLSTRGRRMGNGAPAHSAVNYQHPYSSDRSTNHNKSLPPISSARDWSDDASVDRKPSSGLRSGLDPKMTLPPLNPVTRRW